MQSQRPEGGADCALWGGGESRFQSAAHSAPPGAIIATIQQCLQSLLALLGLFCGRLFDSRFRGLMRFGVR